MEQGSAVAESVEQSELRKVTKLLQRRTKLQFGSWWFVFILSVYASHTLHKVTVADQHCHPSGLTSSFPSPPSGRDLFQRREEIERLLTEKRDLAERLEFHQQQLKKREQETKSERVAKGPQLVCLIFIILGFFTPI